MHGERIRGVARIRSGSSWRLHALAPSQWADRPPTSRPPATAWSRASTREISIVARAASSYSAGDTVAYHSDTLDVTDAAPHRVGNARGVHDQGRQQRLARPGSSLRRPDSWCRVDTDPAGRGLARPCDRTTGAVRSGAHRLLVQFDSCGPTATGAREEATSWTDRPLTPPTRPKDPAPSVKDVVANTRESSLIAWGVVAVGILLSLLAWTRPTTVAGDPAASGAQRSMTFSYTATVPRSPAYQSTEVTAPQPVFRKQADSVQVGVDYVGDPGVQVDAELSTDGGGAGRFRWPAPGRGGRQVPRHRDPGSERARGGPRRTRPRDPMSRVGVGGADGDHRRRRVQAVAAVHLGTESLSSQTPTSR